MPRDITFVDTPNGTWAVGPLSHIARHLAYQRAPALEGRLLQLWTSPTAQSAVPFPEGTQFFIAAIGSNDESTGSERAVGGVTELLVPNQAIGEIWIPGVESDTGIELMCQILVLSDGPAKVYPIRWQAGLVRNGFRPEP
jgi:hypothetical protein